jgi:valyl-tRNA synthetase
MSLRIALRLALPVVLTAALLPAAALAQSQDSQSVAEAARRAREQKKKSDKPAKVITDETLDVRKGDVQSAVAEVPRMPGSSDAQAKPTPGAANAPAAAGANAANSSSTQASGDEKLKKELEALKKQIKDAQSDLDLLVRLYNLDNEAFYSKPDYAGDTAGKQKLDDEKQQISDKRQEVERLKAKLADLQQAVGNPPSAPPQP